MNRKKVIMRNSIIGTVTQVFQMLMSFIIRKIFIRYIGIEYLGINAVLTEILEMLSLTEFGVQNAIIFRLCKPLLANDIDVVSEIIFLLRKLYYIIGSVILVTGFCLFPFLKYIITNVEVSMSAVYIAYFILLLSSVLTYYMGYWRTLLYADQGQYILSTIDAVVNFVASILRIGVIVYFKSFYLYIFIVLCKNTISNLIVTRYTQKKYLGLKSDIVISKELKRNILKDVKNIFAGKAAGYVYSSTDNLVISTIIGTVDVGYIGNYKSITTAANTVMTNIFLSMQPMVGNYVASESNEKAYDFFEKYSFIRFFIACMLLIPLINTIEQFIVWWIGSEYVLNRSIPMLIIIDIYISIVHGSTGEFILAKGLFSYERTMGIIGAIVNIFTSIIGTFILGLEGVLLGTVISQIIMWAGRSIIVHKYCFAYNNKYFFRYWIKEIQFFIIFMVECVFTNKLFFLFNGMGGISVIINKIILSFILCFIIHFIVWRKTKEYIYFKEWSFSLIKSVMRKFGI